MIDVTRIAAELPNVTGYIYPNEYELHWGILIVVYPYLTGLGCRCLYSRFPRTGVQRKSAPTGLSAFALDGAFLPVGGAATVAGSSGTPGTIL